MSELLERVQGYCDEVVHIWSKSIRFFPQDAGVKVEISNRILHWLGQNHDPIEQLDWLKTAVLENMTEWQSGTAIRELFLRRYPLPRGVEIWTPESGTKILDGPRDPVLLLAAVAERKRLPAPTVKLPEAPPSPPGEPFDSEAFVAECARQMEASRATVPDLKHKGVERPKGC
jgi:hypothetical protein